MTDKVNLFALCRDSQNKAVIKRVQIAQGVQEKLSGIFHQQASNFMEGVDDEIQFGHGWKPDSDEILYIESDIEQKAILGAVANAAELDTLNVGGIGLDNIKGLCVVNGTKDAPRILVQSFTAQQNLERKGFAFILQKEVFREVSEPAFTLNSALCAIIEGGKIKFKSFHNLKRVFMLENFYTEATDAEIDAFCKHEHFAPVDATAIKAACSQPMRTLINAVSRVGAFSQVTTQDISKIAESFGVPVSMDADGKIVLPTSRSDLKSLLSFLDDRIYEGPLSNVTMLANSKRPYA